MENIKDFVDAGFVWDIEKDKQNRIKHDIGFVEAKQVFSDSLHIIRFDAAHSEQEHRYYCIGKLERGIVTVRFTVREGGIRIIGAGFWREGKKAYEEQGDDTVHR